MLSTVFLGVSVTAMTVGNLKCEYCSDPMGVDAPQPRLGWVLESAQRARMQSSLPARLNGGGGGRFSEEVNAPIFLEF